MCTVSFYKKENTVIITSNRDEKLKRKSALPPKEYKVNGYTLVFPKDQEKGGTWFAFNKSLNQVIVLLNGGFEKHRVENKYRKSRGIIVLELISNKNSRLTFDEMNLENIEPFTIVLFANDKLSELVWDGESKHVKLIEDESFIWSSVTLYPEKIRDKRRKLFNNFLEMESEINEDKLIDFHTNTDKEDKTNGLVIDRKGMLKTLSVTQIIFSLGGIKLNHFDLIKNQNDELKF